MPSEAEHLRQNCPRARWGGAAKHCQWCDVPLLGVTAKRRRTWCSEKCFLAFQRHHVWAHAKVAALVAAEHHCAAPNCHAPRATLRVLHRTVSPTGYAMSCAHHAENLIVLCPQHARRPAG